MYGNITYASSILAESMGWPYLVMNASWLAGVDVSMEELTYTDGMIREWTECGHRYACKWPKYFRHRKHLRYYANLHITRQKIWLPGSRVDIAMCILERISEAGLFLEAERRETVAGNASLRSSCHYNSPILDYLRSKHLHAFCLVLPRNTAVNFPYQDSMSVIPALLIVLIALSHVPRRFYVCRQAVSLKIP